MRTLLGAVSFLTILKVPGEPVPPGRAALFFPLVGAWIGAAGGGIFLGARMFLPVSLAALLTVAFWTAISGVLHEDGLADVADALRAGRSKETMLAILKDSRIGTYGAVAIVLSVIARWQALEHITSPLVLGVCILAQMIPRAAIVGLAWVSRPVGMGLGHALASTLTTPVALLAAAQGLLAAFALGARSGAIITVGVYLTLRAARWYFYRRIGGVNGDCLGAVEQILEIFVLVVFTCMICGW